jgi:DNA-binding CsgD family transcriptional regulator
LTTSLRRRAGVQAYGIVMEGIAALVLIGLAVWLARVAWRAPSGPFRAVSAGAAAVCVLLGTTSLQHLLLIAIRADLVPSGWDNVVYGPWMVVRASLAVLVGAWAVVLALRYWTHLGRAHSVVDVLTDRVPSEAHARQAGLSAREQEVLGLIRGGTLSDDEIARTLHISSATAATHVQNILRKTGLHNRRDLMLLPPAAPAVRSKRASG